MVFTYFWRAGLQTEEYRLFFFPALLLANQMQEEGGVPHHFYIYTWAFGQLMHMAQLLRTFLFSRMGFRAWGPRETCKLIMAQDPDHWAWRRQRKITIVWERRSRIVGIT
ncbi:Speedy protein C, partial [Pristimantis euphronides]